LTSVDCLTFKWEGFKRPSKRMPALEKGEGVSPVRMDTDLREGGGQRRCGRPLCPNEFLTQTMATHGAMPRCSVVVSAKRFPSLAKLLGHYFVNKIVKEEEVSHTA